MIPNEETLYELESIRQRLDRTERRLRIIVNSILLADADGDETAMAAQELLREIDREEKKLSLPFGPGKPFGEQTPLAFDGYSVGTRSNPKPEETRKA